MHLYCDLLSCQSATTLISVTAHTENRKAGEIVGLRCEIWTGCAGPGAYHRAGQCFCAGLPFGFSCILAHCVQQSQSKPQKGSEYGNQWKSKQHRTVFQILVEPSCLKAVFFLYLNAVHIVAGKPITPGTVLYSIAIYTLQCPKECPLFMLLFYWMDGMSFKAYISSCPKKYSLSLYTEPDWIKLIQLLLSKTG